MPQLSGGAQLSSLACEELLMVTSLLAELARLNL